MLLLPDEFGKVKLVEYLKAEIVKLNNLSPKQLQNLDSIKVKGPDPYLAALRSAPTASLRCTPL